MSGRQSKRVDQRVTSSGAIGVTVGVAMVLLGMEPRLVLVGVIVVVVSSAAWLVVDVGNLTSPIVWYDSGTSVAPPARPDRRVQMLRARLRRGASRRRPAHAFDADRADPVDEIVESLVDVIDGHLRAEHGIERSIDPVLAAHVLGPDLTRFVTDPEAGRTMARHRSLARTLTLIEDL